MFDCQRQLLSFLYLGRSDDDRFTFSGKKVEKVVAETGSLLLEVIFSFPDNFRSKNLTFHIAPFQSGYQART